MSTIPAWKRAGLSVNKNEIENEDNLLETKRIDSANLSTKEIKKVSNKRKLQDDLSHSKTKKPPKRIKLPKSERKPPPIKDQLMYLKTYEEDKPNWKFNKSKQNWVLKNIKDIPKEYETALILYLGSLQGGSRDRLINELREDILKWNVKYDEMERKVEEKLLNGEANEKDEDKKSNEEHGKNEVRNELTLEYITRCRDILKSLVDDEIIVKGLEQNEEGHLEEEKTSIDQEQSHSSPSDEVISHGIESPTEEELGNAESSKKIKKDKKSKNKVLEKENKGKASQLEKEELKVDKLDKKERKEKKEKKEKKSKKDKQSKSEKKEMKDEKQKQRKPDALESDSTSNLIINEIEV
ncbi:uncharacterized protein KGF55_004211 [Candida pseudojiufengensis]|uniref:uncharacterized protein n=1 Tax=Candida pseudojiufengensis TaxID=497109 RepID=UPI002224D8CC|nr:uncharacterized protein KGF55_004211 [Candida pseudojiufengensis]KAI5960944.1 hypothetical protein KGF55_004211 [Candida pseudojiufengensis]